MSSNVNSKPPPLSRKSIQKKYETLFEYTMGVLSDQPSDLVDYGQKFLADGIESRKTRLTYDLTSETETAFIRSLCNSIYFQKRRSAFTTPCYEDIDEKDVAKVITPKTQTQYAKLKEVTGKIFLFRNLTSEEIGEIIDAMDKKHAKKGDIILYKNVCCDNFYVVEKGEYDLILTSQYKNPLVVQTYKAGDTFGEIALINNKPMSGTIVTKTAGTLWVIDQKTFRRIVVKYATLKREEYSDFIDSVPIFKNLMVYEKYKIADSLQDSSFKKGERILKQGDLAEGMYFVGTGEVILKVRKNESDAEVVVCKVQRGGYFGEMSLITDLPRSTSVYAYTDVRLVYLEKYAFERLLGPCIDIMKRDIPSYTRLLEELAGPRACQHSSKSG